MESLSGIIHEARAVRDMANSSSKPDLSSAVMNLADMVISLAHHISNLRDEVERVGANAARGISPVD